MTALPAEVSAKYELLEKMGEGGMGAVFRVRHRFLDEIQVIKVMHAKLRSDTELRTRFLREAKTAKHVRHPNIAEIIDYSVAADDTAYIVMEFISGSNLRELQAQARGPLDFPLVLEIADQALAALSCIHRKGFVHRDISPDNLMLTRDEGDRPLLKLIDLGIAKSIEGTDDLTLAGKFIGKLRYASPEQFGAVDGRIRVDARSDLYSFGVVLYELLTGELPIVGADYRAVIAGHLTRPPRDFDETDIRGAVPARLRRAVMKALAKEPLDRFQSADDFRNELSLVRSTSGDGTTVRLDVQSAVRDAMGGIDDLPPSQSVLVEAARQALLVEGVDTLGFEQPDERLTLASNVNAADTATRRDPASDAATRPASLSDVSAADTTAVQTGSEVASGTDRIGTDLSANQTEADWMAADAEDSVVGWQTFLARHAATGLAASARLRRDASMRREEEEREWMEAERSETPDGWRRYLQSHTTSARADAAMERLAFAELREAQRAAREEEEHRRRSTRVARRAATSPLPSALDREKPAPDAADARMSLSSTAPDSVAPHASTTDPAAERDEPVSLTTGVRESGAPAEHRSESHEQHAGHEVAFLWAADSRKPSHAARYVSIALVAAIVGGSGWVAWTRLESFKTPPAAVAPERDERLAIAVQYVAVPSMQVHTAPAAEAAVTGSYGLTEAISVLEDRGDWRLIRAGSGTGWVRASDLMSAEDARRLEESPTPRFYVKPEKIRGGARGAIVYWMRVNTDGEVVEVRTIRNTTGDRWLAAQNAKELAKARFYPMAKNGRRASFTYEHTIYY